MPKEAVAAWSGITGIEGFRLVEMIRKEHPEPCTDCGRTYLQGENITWQVPTAEPNGHRVVWEGCVDCWIRRTNPDESRAETAYYRDLGSVTTEVEEVQVRDVTSVLESYGHSALVEAYGLAATVGLVCSTMKFKRDRGILE